MSTRVDGSSTTAVACNISGASVMNPPSESVTSCSDVGLSPNSARTPRFDGSNGLPVSGFSAEAVFQAVSYRGRARLSSIRKDDQRANRRRSTLGQASPSIDPLRRASM